MLRHLPTPREILGAAVLLLLLTATPTARAQQPGDATVTPGPSIAPASPITAPTPAIGAGQESVAPRAPARETYTFQVILVRARAGEPSLPDLPENALAALRDLQELTRYRQFEVLDTAFLRTQRAARARLGEAGAFEVYLALGAPQPAPSVGTGNAPAARRSDARRVIVEHFEVAYWRWEKDDAGRIYYSEDPVELVTSTFGLDVGETAVVGTSRLTDADEALVVLVKAVH